MPKQTSRTRSTARTDEQDGVASTVAPIQRRYPRLGTAFQTKVPGVPPPSEARAYQPSRRSPVLLSSEFPDVAVEDVPKDDNMMEEPGNRAPMVVASPGPPPPFAVDDKQPSLPQGETDKGYGSPLRVLAKTSNRGPSTTAGGGTTTTSSQPSPLFPVEHTSSHNRHDTEVPNPDQAWLSRLLDWHQLTLESKEPANGGGRNSRYKRPREVPSVPDLNGTGGGVAAQPPKRTHWEYGEESLLLDYIRSEDNKTPDTVVPMGQKTWSFYVHLSGGRSRRALKKRKRDGELDSWAKAPWPTIPMHGDFRSSQTEKCDPILPPSASSRSVTKVWQAVLAAAKAFDKNLSDVSLNTLLDFFDHVRRLPSPGQCLDETTRIAPSVIECLNRLWKECSEARVLRATWMDLWYEDGVDIETIRKSFKSITTLVPDEYSELQRQVDIVGEWQARLNDALAAAAEDDPDLQRDDLAYLESLALEATKTHGFRCKGYVALQMKLEKIYDMRRKLKTWTDESTEGCTAKTIGAMVREVLRLKIRFSEGNTLLRYSQEVDSWVERADIAIRSRISLREVETLIERGLEFHLDLSEYLDKLQSRVQLARSWLISVGKVVPIEGSNLEWMSRVREKLEEGRITELHDLACEGSRLPVDVDFVQLIHVELEARQWSLKTEKWLQLPGKSVDTSKQGKIEELREHLKKATDLRERLSPSDSPSWPLIFESELAGIVKNADMWFDKQFDCYFGGDHRKASSKRSISIYKLRQIDQDAEAMPVNLGTAHAKVTRYLVQAETWYNSHQKLLLDAGLESLGSPSELQRSKFVSLDQLKKAMDDANKSISFELEEVEKLNSLIGKIEAWFDQVATATATGRRRFRGKKSTYTLDELERLVEEALHFPVDTSKAVEAIRESVSSVAAWQKELVTEFAVAAKAVGELTLWLDQQYGIPSSFLRTSFLQPKNGSTLPPQDARPAKEGPGSSIDVCETTLPCCLPHLEILENSVERLIKGTISSNITTPEMDVINNLDTLFRWISRSIRYLTANDEIFDKRFYGAFDRFLSEGVDLRQSFPSTETSELIGACDRAMDSQLCRMKILLEERNEFSSWSEQIDKILAGEDRRCTVDKLRELNTKAQKFPDENDHVKRIRDLTQRTNDWISLAKRSIESVERLKMAELKLQIDEGDRLGISSGELRELKNGMKAARSWANRVRKCKPELCTAEISEVNALVDDYETLMVEMPEEIARLNQAIKHYCICRGPYGGQMISCEECQDSFHASCLGITKVRAEKMEKYVCIRCSLKKAFRTSSATIAAIVKKWTSDKELHKARQIEFQKYQRKSRKEYKDLEKHQKVVEETKRLLAAPEAKKPVPEESSEAGQVFTGVSAETSEAADVLLSVPSGSIKNDTAVAPKEPMQPVHQIIDPVSSGSFPSTSTNPETLPLEKGQTRTESNAVDGSASTVLESNDFASREVEKSLERNQLVSKLEKATRAIDECQARLKALELGEEERKKREQFENSQAAQIQQWCMLVRKVMAPPTEEEAASGQPSRATELSCSMEFAITHAQKLAIDMHVDVNTVHNAFKCICWLSRAMEVLRRQPKAKAITDLVAMGRHIKLPEEKTLRFLRGVANRIDAWNARYKKVVTPLPGEISSIPMIELKELAAAAEKIPVILRYEHRLEAIIEDDGTRYCLCGGPSDGRFMVGCDKCERWFHGCCVGVCADDEVDNWYCPSCTGTVVDPAILAQKFHDAHEEIELPAEEDNDDVASKAPDPETLWPPFGLKEAQGVLDAMGMEVSFTEAEACPEPVSIVAAVVTSSSSENTDVGAQQVEPQLDGHDDEVQPLPNHDPSGELKPAVEESSPPLAPDHANLQNQPSKGQENFATSMVEDHSHVLNASLIEIEGAGTATDNPVEPVGASVLQCSSSSSAMNPAYSVQTDCEPLSGDADAHSQSEFACVPPVQG